MSVVHTCMCMRLYPLEHEPIQGATSLKKNGFPSYNSLQMLKAPQIHESIILCLCFHHCLQLWTQNTHWFSSPLDNFKLYGLQTVAHLTLTFNIVWMCKLYFKCICIAINICMCIRNYPHTKYFKNLNLNNSKTKRNGTSTSIILLLHTEGSWHPYSGINFSAMKSQT